MKYEQIDKQLFIHNRAKFVKELAPNAIAVFNSNDIVTTGADSTTPFVQHRDIFYLSGVDQEESILVLFPDCKDEKHREILFLKETNETIAIWEGEKLNEEQAFETSGIKTVYWLTDFDRVFESLMTLADNVYLNTNEHHRANKEAETRDDRFRTKCKSQYPLHTYKRSAPIMHKIRSIKHPIELELMQKACNITEKGVRRLLSYLKPGVMEYNLEAELTHEFLNNRSKGFAYTPIVASGFSACVLHYIENNKECKDGDVILMYFGAEYANYASDLTRSFPVNGKFTDRQKAVYNSVLKVKKEATKLLVPGTLIPDYHVQVGKLMETELLTLGFTNITPY